MVGSQPVLEGASLPLEAAGWQLGGTARTGPMDGGPGLLST